MITCSVVGNMGRLGNQLFQIATTVAYALDNGQEYMFPRWDYQDYINLPIGTPISYYEPVNEINLRYNELPRHTCNVNLHGHFLSTKYFQHRKKELVDLLRPKDIKCSVLPYGVPSCSIHVRRGDYLNPEQLEAHGVMPMSYYEKAMDIVREKHPDVIFYVLSDDITWCMENFKGCNFVHHEKDIEDLIFMTRCQHHIISNSTFGWWGAWLSCHSYGKTVVAPRQWFAKTEGWDDLYEPYWTVI